MSLRLPLNPVLLCALASIACASEHDIIPITDDCLMGCETEIETRWANATGVSDEWGSAVVSVAWGSSTTTSGEAGPTLIESIPDKRYRAIVGGAPASGHGTVYVKRASVNSGAMNQRDPQVVPGPEADTLEFGAALAAADIRDGRTFVLDPSGGAQVRPTGFGEELIVGAPGTNDYVGAIYWYEGHRSPGQDWNLAGKFVPAGAAAGGRFGAAIATPTRWDASFPTMEDTRTPEWIAVGAPGDNKVYLLSVNPGSTTPLAVLQVLSAGVAGAEYGAALLMDDFDSDGKFDLVVGAPSDGANGTGRVYLYKGVGSRGVDPATVEVVAAGTELSAPDRFGASLASGFIDPISGDRQLLVGAPGTDAGAFVNTGALCVMDVPRADTLSPTNKRCWVNPELEARARWGAQVAVGNFANHAAQYTCAVSDEVMVSAPGADLLAFTDIGRVDLLSADTLGITPTEPAEAVFFGIQAGERFGAALDADLIQKTHSADAIIGSPGAGGGQGAVSITRAYRTGGIDDSISGVWTGEDSGGEPFEMAVVWTGTHLEITQLTSAHTVFGPSVDSPCNRVGQRLESTGVLEYDPIAWSTSGVDNSVRTQMAFATGTILGTVTLEGTLSFDADANTFTMRIDEDAGVLGSFSKEECPMLGNPYVFRQIDTFTCDE